MSGIDTAMPDVRSKWSNHAAWNQNELYWEQDFRQIAECGFDLLRWQMPWSLVEPRKGEYRWDLLDPKIEFASRLGLEVFYPIVHFNIPSWLPEHGEIHAVFSGQLCERVAEYTHQILSRYKFKLVIPWVEVAMDAHQRGRVGNWQPHLKGRKNFEAVYEKLIPAYKASAQVAHEHGATVVCSEPAPDLQTVLDLRDCTDIAGIDLYPHVHRQMSVLAYLRNWSRRSGLPLCLSEFGTPESYNPKTRKDSVGRFVRAGLDGQRVEQARLLHDALKQAHREGIEMPLGGWYPGTGNIGWGDALTKERKKFDCDRAGLVDLARQPDGSLKRVLCADLVKEVIGLREIYTPQPQVVRTPASMPMLPLLPEALPALSL